MIIRKKHTITEKECTSVSCLKKHQHSHLIRKMHKKHRISYKTLFYMKEYGPRSHVASVIISQSLKMLLITAIISSVGGVKLKGVEDSIITILPLLILLPALNTMIGNAGTVVSSKFTTLLYLGRVEKKWWKEKDVHKLIVTVFTITIISAVYIGVLSYIISMTKGFAFDFLILGKVLAITLLASASLVLILVYISIRGGLWIYRMKEDPNNFLIPMTTSVADFGSMFIFATMVALFF